MKPVLTAVMLMTAATAAAERPVATADGLARFASETAAFAAAGSDHVHDAAVLFLGSSSIRLWDIGRSFPKIDVVNRGFGGATTEDVLVHYDQVIAGVQPAVVIVYVGENDIAEGASAEQAAGGVLTLLARLRADMPHARIAYLSMKPTPLRWDLYPRLRAANAVIKARSGVGRFDYLDVGGVLLAADGGPDPVLFQADGLHLGERGYKLWTEILDHYLQPPEGAVAAVRRAS